MNDKEMQRMQSILRGRSDRFVTLFVLLPDRVLSVLFIHLGTNGTLFLLLLLFFSGNNPSTLQDRMKQMQRRDGMPDEACAEYNVAMWQYHGSIMLYFDNNSDIDVDSSFFCRHVCS